MANTTFHSSAARAARASVKWRRLIEGVRARGRAEGWQGDWFGRAEMATFGTELVGVPVTLAGGRVLFLTRDGREDMGDPKEWRVRVWDGGYHIATVGTFATMEEATEAANSIANSAEGN